MAKLDYEKYEADCEQQRAANDELLKEFRAWIKSTGLTDKTAKNHSSNVDFYINEFLLYEDVTKPEDGADGIGMYLGYWFIKKAAWSSAANVKGSSTSLTKFYTFLLEKKLIEAEVLLDLKATIKEEMADWLEQVEHFDDDLDMF
jgi:intergrase/recombinase